MKRFLMCGLLLVGCGSDTSNGWEVEEDQGIADLGPGIADMAQDVGLREPDLVEVDMPAALGGDVTFFSLPINSWRLAVSTFDPDLQICVSTVFFMNTPDTGDGPICEPSSPGGWDAYVTVGTERDCWDYGPNAELVAFDGCVDFEERGHADTADLTINITSDLYSGPVRYRYP